MLFCKNTFTMKHIIRLFTPHPLRQFYPILPSKTQEHHVQTVMRKMRGKIHLFNGQDGLWEAQCQINQRQFCFIPEKCIQQQPQHPQDITLVLPYFKQYDLCLSQATQLGVTHVATYFADKSALPASGFNADRMRKILISGSEQSQRLHVPYLHHPQTLSNIIKRLADEQENVWLGALSAEKRHVVSDLWSSAPNDASTACALIVGPEGGWSDAENAFLSQYTHFCSLGPYILRTETAVLSALSIICQKQLYIKTL